MPRPKKDIKDKCVRKDISMEPGQLKTVTEFCQREERSISWVVRKALEEYLGKVA